VSLEDIFWPCSTGEERIETQFLMFKRSPSSSRPEARVTGLSCVCSTVSEEMMTLLVEESC